MIRLAAVAVLLSAIPAFAQEAAKKEEPHWTVGGYLSTDLSLLKSTAHNRNTQPEEGISGEYGLNATYYDRHGLTVTIQTCFGCHGLEIKGAYADLEVTDAITVRAGRIPVPFGSFSRRTNPSHMEGSTRPLPYIMGGMVREDEFNLGVVPGPIVDNGFSISANQWLFPTVQVGIETAVVRGLKGSGPDFDFAISRDFEDNNGEPAESARLTLSAPHVDVGVSFMTGTFDPDAELSYTMEELDVAVNAGGWRLSSEFVGRSTRFFDLSSVKRTSRRLGYAVQLDGPIDDTWRVFVLQDGLSVKGVFLSSAGPLAFAVAGSTDDSNSISRTSGGVSARIRSGVLAKASAEHWNFSDFADTWMFHFTLVVEF